MKIRRHFVPCLTPFLLFGIIPPLPGQEPPPRPELAAGADTNSANAYYEFGLERLERRPKRAADAFYWACRLEPTWAEPWYAQWVARLLAPR